MPGSASSRGGAGRCPSSGRGSGSGYSSSCRAVSLIALLQQPVAGIAARAHVLPAVLDAVARPAQLVNAAAVTANAQGLHLHRGNPVTPAALEELQRAADGRFQGHFRAPV